jgi:L-alanine-DL-glutamate epimerase-like enolase superfamily enzyme
MRVNVPIGKVRARAFTIPTDKPEADGTIAWNSTTLIVVEVFGGNAVGLAYTYAGASITSLIDSKLAETIAGLDAMDPQTAWRAMQRAVRNLGREGLAATAISAVDAALYDLKARILDVPLATLLGTYRDTIPIYGSGGFTTYSDEELKSQLGGWVCRDGCAFVKMKVGTDPDDDPRRVAVAKAAIGEATLLVDANGAYTVKQALALATRFADQKIGWFEEPVSSDDLRGLREIREGAPVGMDIAAGEYAYTISYVRAMLEAEAVDVQQADVTRCGGVTAFLQIGALCEAFHIDLSGHCAPALHLHVACAVPRLRHLEWFHDHVRIEHILFEGAPIPKGGTIRPDLSRPGNGLVFKHQDALRYAA